MARHKPKLTIRIPNYTDELPKEREPEARYFEPTPVDPYNKHKGCFFPQNGKHDKRIQEVIEDDNQNDFLVLPPQELFSAAEETSEISSNIICYHLLLLGCAIFGAFSFFYEE